MTRTGADAPGTLRDLVRSEVLARQLSRHLPAARGRVLDVGGDSPARAVHLARAGFDVVVIAPSDSLCAAMLAVCESEPEPVRAKLDVRTGSLGRLAQVVGGCTFDVVLCQGGLARTAAAREAVVELSDLVASGGVVSLVALNADAVALSPALQGRWVDALDLLSTAGAAGDPQPVVVAATGGPARAQRLEELAAYVSGRRMHVEGWYGVGFLTSGPTGDRLPPVDADERDAVLAAEELAGRTDPYRRVAPLLHIVGRRGTG